MTILGVQILGILFALFMFYITFLHQRRNEFTVKESIFWFGAWLSFLFLVIFPTSLDFFINPADNHLHLMENIDGRARTNRF